MHEDALVGLQLKVANGFGSFRRMRDLRGFARANTTEWELEQDVVAALRVLPRGQLALLVPAIQTYRRTPNQSSFGGGLGDINFSGRYDFVLAGEARYVPGIALLAGVTFPTGESIEEAEDLLGTDSTGVGTYQANLGLALEQTVGPWLFGVTGLVAKRATRTVGPTTTSLAAQWTLLAATAYTFPNDAALAAVVSYAVEGDPVVNGMTYDSTRRIPIFGVAGLYPFTDQWRLQGGLYFNPPISSSVEIRRRSSSSCCRCCGRGRERSARKRGGSGHGARAWDGARAFFCMCGESAGPSCDGRTFRRYRRRAPCHSAVRSRCLHRRDFLFAQLPRARRARRSDSKARRGVCPARVRILAVDPEIDASLERDRAEAERRRYPFPILLDRGGGLARSLGATYAGYAVVLDRDGGVRYRGGIDADRVRMRDDATPYLSDALSDLLAGKTPRVAESKTLGCALRLR